MFGDLSCELKGDAMAALRSEYRTQSEPPLRSDCRDPGFDTHHHDNVEAFNALAEYFEHSVWK